MKDLLKNSEPATLISVELLVEQTQRIYETLSVLHYYSNSCPNPLSNKIWTKSKELFEEVRELWLQGQPLDKKVPQAFIETRNLRNCSQKGATDFLFLVVLLGEQAQKNQRTEVQNLLRWALYQGWDPHYFNGKSTTVGLCAYSGQADLLEVMEEFGADTQLKMNRYGIPGETLLHRIVEGKINKIKSPQAEQEVIHWLISHYPDPNPKDALGRTPLIIAQRQGREDIASMIEVEISKRCQIKLDENLPQSKKSNPRHHL